MINLFQIAGDDQSIKYLGNIFGSMNGLLPAEGDLSLLGTMFKTFNSTILALAALLIVYVTVVGVMKTAHEGEFMGKNWNNIWLPIRVVLGVAMMVPTGSGYSGLQIVMMWIIIQGIGAADTLWSTALSYVNVVGSPYAQAGLPGVGVQQSFVGLFQGLTCDATARVPKKDPSGLDNGGYFCSVQSSSICNTPPTIKTTGTQLSLGPDGSCGSLTYCDTTAKCATGADSLECLSCQAQVTALQTIVPILSTIGTELANADYSFRDFLKNSANPNANRSGWAWINSYCTSRGISSKNCCVQSDAPNSTCAQGSTFPDPNAQGQPQNASSEVVKNVYWKFWPRLGPNLGTDASFIKTASGFYMDAATKAYTSYIASKANEPISGDLGEAQNKGWIFAGGYYYTIANRNDSNLRAALPSLTWEPPADLATGTMSHYRNNYNAALELANAASSAAYGSTPAAGSMGLFSSTMESVTTMFDSAKTGTNPLVTIQGIGTGLLVLAEVLFIAVLVIILAVGIPAYFSVYVVGTGFDNPLGPFMQLLMFFFIPAFYALMGYLITLGGMLGVYVPLIPYIMFTFGAIGWIISVIEAMVAGPLVALGVISPSGHHEILGKSEHALMLILNIFLRPSLMIFGLMAAMLLAVVVVNFINALFFPIVVSGLAKQGGTSALVILMLLGAYVMLIVAALNKCFAVINVIPQKVMGWIGGHGEEVAPPMEEIKKGISGVGAGATGAAGGVKTGASQGMGKMETDTKTERKAAEKEAAKKAKEDAKKQQ